MLGLMVDGSWVETPDLVKKGAKEFFQEKFKGGDLLGLNLDGVPFRKISDSDNLSLIAAFDPGEVREAVWQCGNDKSPGPDGVNFRFIKQFWHLMSTDIQKLLDDFHRQGYWPRGCNSSFITLVPKKENPQGLQDFRPISLIGCAYKIISKVLTNRIKSVLPAVIDDCQSAFLEGRGALDSIVVANEWLHDAKTRKKKSMAFKVDFEKAYDSVQWNFLYYMMRRMNFNGKWIAWVKGCIESAKISVLINGSPGEEFAMGKGIRQGDPIAPFLFLIVAEGLNGLLRQALHSNDFKGYSFVGGR